MSKTSRKLSVACGIIMIFLAISDVFTTVASTVYGYMFSITEFLFPLVFCLMAVYFLIPARFGWRNVFFFIAMSIWLLLEVGYIGDNVRYIVDVIGYGYTDFDIMLDLSSSLFGIFSFVFPAAMILTKIIRRSWFTFLGALAGQLNITIAMLTAASWVSYVAYELNYWLNWGFSLDSVYPLLHSSYYFFYWIIMILFTLLFWLAESTLIYARDESRAAERLSQ